MLQVGDRRVKLEYRTVVLQNTTKSKQAVWSCKEKGVDLHLSKGKWCLSSKDLPKESNMAFVERCSVAPPAARVWKLGKSMRVDSDEGDEWAEAELTLLYGRAGKARAVRGISQHTRMRACYCDVLRPPARVAGCCHTCGGWHLRQAMSGECA